MRKGPSGKQPKMCEGFDYARGLSQPMVFPDNYPNHKLRGEAKEIVRALPMA
jgi:hypothetical protein